MATAAQPLHPGMSDDGQARAHLLLALDEQEIRAETIRRLLLAAGEQQARLRSHLTAALRVFDKAEIAPGIVDPQAPPLAARSSVRCLGPLELTIAGVTVKNWRSGKARALLEYLVTHRDRPSPRDTLIEALWPDPDAVAAATSLKVAAHALRQMIAEISAAGPRPMTILVHESSYQLVCKDLWVDVEEFEQCCALGRRLDAQGRHSEALELYSRAAELYGGDFLSDAFEDWVVFRREGLKDQYLTVLARLVDAAVAAGDYERGIRLCRQILEQDDCREDTFRTLMLCHSRLGQRGRVRRWYEVCVKTLRDTLDVEPEPETVRLYKWATHGDGND
jgi:DNA-binding SARP family transcriptional activator